MKPVGLATCLQDQDLSKKTQTNEAQERDRMTGERQRVGEGVIDVKGRSSCFQRWVWKRREEVITGTLRDCMKFSA